jgi:hypothetical protein
MRSNIFVLSFLFLIIVANSLFSQNLESIGKEKPLTVTGGVSFSQIFYGVSGIESRRDPYTYFASGNVNFSLYGWSVPLSFSLSNQNTSFQQPFNQYSLHPTYKWVTGHFGYTSMSFSTYTVSGHIFLRAGADVAPEGKWRFSGLYGRFLKAVELKSDSTDTNTPAYERMGYGFKASYGSGANQIDVILFHGEDDPSSIAAMPDSLGISPEENIVASIGVSKSLFESIIVKAEVASSALSTDTRAVTTENSNPLSKADFLFSPRISTSYYNAYKSSVTYQSQGYAIGLGYERIDPQFRTHGAYFFNNDLENITVNGSAALLQGKMNIAANAGTQRDNLDKSKISTMRRLVGSANIGYTPSQKLNLSLSYSNFQTFTNIRSQFVDINQLTPFDNLDTLNFTQISQNATLTAMYAIGDSKSKRQSISANLTFQDAADKQGGVNQNSGSRFYNGNIAYSLGLTPQNMTVSVSFNTTINETSGPTGKTLGPTAAVSKSFFDKKLRTTFSTAYNNSYQGSDLINSILNGRINASITLKKKHNLNLSTVVVNRKSKGETSAQAFTEFTGTLGYSYSFGLKQ